MCGGGRGHVPLTCPNADQGGPEFVTLCDIVTLQSRALACLTPLEFMNSRTQRGPHDILGHFVIFIIHNISGWSGGHYLGICPPHSYAGARPCPSLVLRRGHDAPVTSASFQYIADSEICKVAYQRIDWIAVFTGAAR